MSSEVSKKACILVVDDDAFIRHLLRVVLAGHGFAVREAEGGEAAIAAVLDGGIDLVLLDYSMPDLSGVETCERIRTTHPELPVIYLTGGADELVTREALPGGAQDLVAKPFEEDDLVARISRLVVGTTA